MLCPGCFEEKGEGDVCPHCGWNEAEQATEFALPPRTRLQRRYVVGRVLGKPGGFGITYLAGHEASSSLVAIKEFLPRTFAGRAADNITVAAYRGSEDEFAYGLKQFQDEYRNLERFDHLNVVRTRDFFQENGTAYLVMDFYEGQTLEEYQRGQGGRIQAKQAADILLPVLDGLRAVHGQGFLHRDVKPANVYLAKGRDGLGARPILLDFGGAKAALGQRTQSMSELWTGGFSPFEQYQRRGRFGPWSDVYSCGATLYALVTGQAPPDAPDRIMDDELDPPSVLVPGLPPAFDAAVLRALAVRPPDRFQTIEELTRALLPVSSAQAWDVFLCKNSKDLEYARHVHDYLAAHGLKVFLSELAVPDSSRTEYGAVIDQAVESCAHMVVVASKSEHLESPYVQAELRMFVEEQRSGRKRGNLISVLAGSMGVADLPISLRSHQAVRLDQAGLAELGRFVGAREAATGSENAAEPVPAPLPEPEPRVEPEPESEPAMVPEQGVAVAPAPQPKPREVQEPVSSGRKARLDLAWEVFFALAGLAVLIQGLVVTIGLGALDLGALFRIALGLRLLVSGIRARKRPGLTGGILFGLAMLGASLIWAMMLVIVRAPGDIQSWEFEYMTLSVSAQGNLFMALGLAFFGLSLGRRRTVLLHVLGAALLGLSLLALPLSWTLMQRPGEGMTLDSIIPAQQTMIIYFALASACLTCLGGVGFLASIRVMGRRFSLLFGAFLVLFLAYLAWFPHYWHAHNAWHCFLFPSLYLAILAVGGARTDVRPSESSLGGWLRIVALGGGLAVLVFLFLSVFRLGGEMHDIGSNETPAPASAHVETSEHQIGDTWTDPLSGMEFSWVPGGCYDMGCGSWDGECSEDELPVHQVCVDGFWLGSTEVTRGQWIAYRGLTNVSQGEPNKPAIQVSWNEAHALIRNMNEADNGSTGFRLPTEAEWEYACRGGGQSEAYAGGSVDNAVVRGDDGPHDVSPVGTLPPNRLGLYDMGGNVREWVEDVYEPDAYALSSSDNPLQEGEGHRRVTRGGSYIDDPPEARCANRDRLALDGFWLFQGVRLAMSPVSAGGPEIADPARLWQDITALEGILAESTVPSEREMVAQMLMGEYEWYLGLESVGDHAESAQRRLDELRKQFPQ